MIEKLIFFVIALIVIGFVFYLIDFAIGQIPTAAPIRNVVRALLALILALILLYMFFGGGRFGVIDSSYRVPQRHAHQTVDQRLDRVHSSSSSIASLRSSSYSPGISP